MLAYHCIFHVIAAVGDDSHNGVGANRIAVHPIIVIHAGPHQRALWGVQVVQLVIRAILVVVNRKPHGLLSWREGGKLGFISPCTLLRKKLEILTNLEGLSIIIIINYPTPWNLIIALSQL